MSLFYIYTMYFLLFHISVLIFFNIIKYLILNELIILYLYNLFIIMDDGEITNWQGYKSSFNKVFTRPNRAITNQ